MMIHVTSKTATIVNKMQHRLQLEQEDKSTLLYRCHGLVRPGELN